MLAYKIKSKPQISEKLDYKPYVILNYFDILSFGFCFQYCFRHTCNHFSLINKISYKYLTQELLRRRLMPSWAISFSRLVPRDCTSVTIHSQNTREYLWRNYLLRITMWYRASSSAGFDIALWWNVPMWRDATYWLDREGRTNCDAPDDYDYCDTSTRSPVAEFDTRRPPPAPLSLAQFFRNDTK